MSRYENPKINVNMGAAKPISIINEAPANNPFYLEWLKTQQWDGRLPLVVGEGETPFISIPTTQ